MTKNILVAGATGTVGRQVMAQLRTAGVDARALKGDLKAPESLAFDGADALFLVWPFASTDGLEAVLKLAAEHVSRVVYLSSAALRDFERDAERLIERSGLEWTFLRPHTFAANALRWAEPIRAGGVVREPYAQAAMSLVHERDIAEAAVRALTQDGHAGAAYELAGPDSLTQAEQVRIIGEVLGRKIRLEEVTPAVGREQMLAKGWPPGVVDDVLLALSTMTGGPTRAGATPFRAWVEEHAHAFRSAMTAARIHGYGGADVISVEEAPIPSPGPGEVLVKVAATSFNPSETALRSGYFGDGIALPYTLGWDVSGTVVQAGKGVTRWAPGERVIGRLDAGGAAAEYVVAPADVLAAAPVAIALEDAAAIPVAALSAWQAVFEHTKVAAGQRVLINGAGGGVGGFAVQLAKRAGATVIATAGPRSAEAVRAHGADQIVDYTAEPLPGDMDVVINLAAISQEAAAELAALVRPGGVAVSISTPIPSHPHFIARNDPAQLAEIVALVDGGDLRVEVAERRPLTDLAAVHRDSEAGRTRGKIIVLPALPGSADWS